MPEAQTPIVTKRRGGRGEGRCPAEKRFGHVAHRAICRRSQREHESSRLTLVVANACASSRRDTQSGRHRELLSHLNRFDRNLIPDVDLQLGLAWREPRPLHPVEADEAVVRPGRHLAWRALAHRTAVTVWSFQLLLTRGLPVRDPPQRCRRRTGSKAWRPPGRSGAPSRRAGEAAPSGVSMRSLRIGVEMRNPCSGGTSKRWVTLPIRSPRRSRTTTRAA